MARLDVGVKENRSDVDQEHQEDRGREEREEIACHVISFAAQPWNTTPIRVSDDSTGSFAGTNNDPALCPGLTGHGHLVCHNEYMAALLGQ